MTLPAVTVPVRPRTGGANRPPPQTHILSKTPDVAPSLSGCWAELKGIQLHRVRLASGKELAGLTAMNAEQRALFTAIGVEVPTTKLLKAASQWRVFRSQY